MNRNIAKKIGGKKNPFYSWIFWEMTKADGTTRKVPPRPIYFVLNTEDMNILVGMGRKAMTRMLDRMAGK